jgi:hypothetical protein
VLAHSLLAYGTVVDQHQFVSLDQIGGPQSRAAAKKPHVHEQDFERTFVCLATQGNTVGVGVLDFVNDPGQLEEAKCLA